MAIGFARAEFVKRSSGKNACAKAAYNSRSKIELQANEFTNTKTYDWSSKTAPAYHEILLPTHVDLKFKTPTTLWNAVETKEVKSNAQVAMEVVLALPDDKVISIEDKVYLAKSFTQTHFIDKGLGAQLDIHAPEPILIVTRDNKELGLKKGMRGDIISQEDDKIVIELDSTTHISFNPQEFTGFIIKEHNWHAHILTTTRRFKENGLEFNDLKARDLMPRINKGKVISGPDWGKLWTEHQNAYFQQKGLELRVDANGLVPQEHLGPYRMRARAFSLFEEHHRILEANRIASQDPEQILEAITSQKSIFTIEDVEHFLSKHSPGIKAEPLIKEFWQQSSIVQLVDKKTGELLSKFTSQTVLAEEQQLLRLSDRIYDKPALKIRSIATELPLKELNEEQKKAFNRIVQGKRLSLIQGYAGTGKSYLLKALQSAYEDSGYRIRALGPDNATTNVLKEKGLSHTENVYRFLFALHNDRRNVLKGKEVWILDEAGKLGNKPLLEFLREAEKRDVQVVLSGDAAQLPPVERGGIFKVFCEKYESQVLENIQRQEMDRHREIALNLATGEFGSAIDKLCEAQGIRWSGTRKEAMEELIIQWARDTRAFPSASTLIIAHSNSEVRVLNEMVRLIRKQRGELEEKEFECTTQRGKVFVSVGDRIEFRKKDKELGLINGLSGTLIEAKEDLFVVAIRESGQKPQTVTFNPQKYHAFQLGYASTFYRSQGRTIGRGYVLHSPMMNKEMFYVGLTRHVKNVSYFVSKDEIYCLADLKRMALKSSRKPLTVEYTTLQEISAQKAGQARNQEIENLKSSDSFVNKFKGYGLEAWDRVVKQAVTVKERIQDRLPDQAFYQPAIQDGQQGILPVIELPKEVLAQETKIGEGSKILQTQIDSLPQEKTMNIPFSSYSLKGLNPEQGSLMRDYLEAVDKVASLKFTVDTEVEQISKDMKFAPHFKEWQQACGMRNKAAYELLGKIDPRVMEGGLETRDIQIVKEQAQRHELSLTKQQKSKLNLEEHLRENLETLLYRLYPEGPTVHDRTSFRFGNKGSLSVVHSGHKAGQFFDFERQEGGGLLKLIQRELGLGRVEAKAWAHDFLGAVPDISVPIAFTRSRQPDKPEDVWTSLKPDLKNPAPKLENIKGIGAYFDEVCRHPYHDENGQLLYYVLRLKDKKDPTRKITPPLSYGYWQSQPEKRGWELKGFQADKRPLYNLHQLKENPQATILLVEGEKTADQALNNLPGGHYICMTWSGGAGAVQKSDWTPLYGRKVLVWPDNDRAGYEAADKACCELKKVGVESLRVVNKLDLEKNFPQKWDLADSLPENMRENLLEQLIASAQDKGIDVKQAISRLGLDPKDLFAKARVNELLWRVDERMRPGLELKYERQYWKTNENILQETCRIFAEQGKRKDDLREKCGVEGVVLERLNYQTALFEAAQGRPPKMHEMQIMKEVIRQDGHLNISRENEKNVVDFGVEKMLASRCEKALSGIGLERLSVEREKLQADMALTQHQVSMTKLRESSNEKGINLSQDHGK